MGFYHSSGQPPEDPNKPMGWRDTLAMIGATFRVLALPLGLLLGVMTGIVVVGYLFFTHWALGMSAVLVLLAIVAVRAWWEWRHPPTLESLDRR